MDALLINPKNTKSRFSDVMPPMGLAFIACVLEKNGYGVEILDLEIKPDQFDIGRYIRDRFPKIVGVSGTSHSRFESFRIARIAKQVSDEIFTVYGGCHASCAADDTLSHIKEIDYIVHGEGEETFLELAEHLISGNGSINGIAGVSYRKDGKIMHNIPLKRIAHLDDIPYSRHLLDMKRYDMRLDFLNVPAVSIITSRGCPYDCYFCSAHIVSGKIHTMRSAANIVDEIQYCIDTFNTKGIKFFDNILTLNREHIISLIGEMRRRNIRLPWECEIRVDTVDRHLLRSMREAGCYYVDFGVESANPEVLKRINKGITIEQIENVLRWCKEFTIKTKCFFSFGHPGETWHDSENTLAFIERHIDFIAFLAVSFGVKIYPGTMLERYAREESLLLHDFSWSEPFKDFKENPIFTDNVPLLLQPSYGINELSRCYYQLYRYMTLSDMRARGLRGVLNKITRIKSLDELSQKTSNMLKTALSK